jgi:DNA-binding GntR family transcriptional regulator
MATSVDRLPAPTKAFDQNGEMILGSRPWGRAAVTAVGDIADRLRRDIVAGTIGLGDRLKLEALAQRYSTGHMPVREALRQLAGEGLVEIAPNRGARVREVDLEFVHNLFDLRIVIEALIARRCAERIDAPQLAELEAAQAHYEAVAGGATTRHWSAPIALSTRS